MSNTFEEFMKVARDSAAVPSAELVGAMVAECPSFTVPAILRLRRAPSLSDTERAELRQRVALCASDLDMLYDLIGRPDADGEPFYPPEPVVETPDTDTTIDTYLELYGHGSDPREDALLERMILNPTPEYAAVLEEEYGHATAAPADDQDRLIDAFLEEEREGAPLLRNIQEKPVATETPAPEIATLDDVMVEITAKAAPQPSPESVSVAEPAAPPKPRREPLAEPRDDSSLSESLAKIYIRQGKYDKAYEILSHLNLNIPSKSSYFADQLRFLQKLMLNSKYNPTKDK